MVVPASGSKAFGLIELIVVIALLAILLVGLLVPAILSALEKANQAACKGNLKFVGTACQTWATDHGQRWPDVFTEASERWDHVGNTRTDQWVGVSNKDEPPHVAPGDNGEPIQSNTANFWHLIANAGMPVHCFLCPSSAHLRDARAARSNEVRDFRGPRFVSYSYQNVLGLYEMTEGQAYRASSLAVVADANPMRRDFWSGAPGGAVKNGLTDRALARKPQFRETDETVPWNQQIDHITRPWELNSPNHQFLGQNVLYLDGHVEWREHPYCGTNWDNIWLRRRTDVADEPEPAKIETVRAHNDTTSYDGTSTLPPDSRDDSFLVP